MNITKASVASSVQRLMTALHRMNFTVPAFYVLNSELAGNLQVWRSRD